MTENIPHFIPLWQIDPHHHPRRNRRHGPPKTTRRKRFGHRTDPAQWTRD
ncbi:hypothetical protein HQQ80_15895 [Microbacteriaceae bacterium VKM Ac-2855]|nr:hypothetical protein [Microbacteriaceae bacterium VKM Ac-2855]